MEEQVAQGETLLSEPSTTTEQWYGDEYKEVVAKKGWKAPTDALKSYVELEKTFSGRVKMPTPESSAEEIRQFYQKTGCPENPDGYEIQVPEEVAALRDEAAESELRKVAHEMDVSKQAFEAIVGKYYGQMANQMVQSRVQGETALKEEFGDKYDENVKIAQRFAGNCSEEFRELMEKTGMGNNPIIIKEFINLGKKTMSDSLIKGEQGSSAEEAFVPSHQNSPDMYKHGEDEYSVKARAYFSARGHKY